MRSRLEEKPDSLVFARLAEILFEANKRDAAFALLEKGLAQNPNYITAYMVLANMYLNSGKIESAKELYRKVLEIDPFNISALSHLAQIEINLGRLSVATAHLMQILSIDPHNKTAFDIIAQNAEKIKEEIPILFEEPVEEPPPLEVETIGGGVFSLIGVEPAVDVRPLPVISRESAVELTVLEHIVKTPPMEPVEMNEIEQTTEDLVELDDIFKAFEPPPPVPEPEKKVEKEKIPEEKVEIDASYFPEEPEPKSEEKPVVEDESAEEVEVELGFLSEVPEEKPVDKVEGKESVLEEGLELSWDEEKPSEPVAEKSEKAGAEDTEGELVLDIQGDIFTMESSEDEVAETTEPETVSEVQAGEKQMEKMPAEEISVSAETSRSDESVDEISIEQVEIEAAEPVADVVEEKPAEQVSAEGISGDIELPDEIFSFGEGEELSEGDTGAEEKIPSADEKVAQPESQAQDISEKPPQLEIQTEEELPESEQVAKKDEVAAEKVEEDSAFEGGDETIELPDEIFKMDEHSGDEIIDISSQVAQEQSEHIVGENVSEEEIVISENIFSPEEPDEEKTISLDGVSENQPEIQMHGEEISAKSDSEIEQDAVVEIPEQIVPVDGLVNVGDEVMEEQERIVEESSAGEEEIITEEIDGFQTTRTEDFKPPEDVEPISGLAKREDFTPPEDTIEIEGLERRPDEPLGEIPVEELENLLGQDNENLNKSEPTEVDVPNTPTPPKDIATATTAEIFAAQGMTDKAIAIYEKLLAQSDISEEDRQKFLARIEILKKRAG